MHRLHYSDRDEFAVLEEYELRDGWVTIVGEGGTVEVIPSHRIERIVVDTEK